jgi:hypothetical protein
LVERWNGTSWSIVTSPDANTIDNFLNGVSCATSTTICYAVGFSRSPARTLLERWNGSTWSIVASPNPTGGGVLNSVTCLSGTRCYAVGYGGSPAKTLVERLDPSSPSWSMMTSPNPTGYSYLNGVTCASTTSCDAVGYSATSPNFLTGSTLVEQWNGTSWSIVTSPNGPPGTTSAALSGVSCPTTTSCYAVGNYRAGPTNYTLTEKYA